ncbi:hypothetical protein WJX74_001273 [Apatococcus lobatus]|uniref:50S ribosomal protein L14 n=1 Tax=Apatococcus lobatus TaxID=904363 RepID=A0AAW1R194_9CHLO
MIGSGTFLDVTDNSGARVVQCINQSGTAWRVGDTITVAVKSASKGKVTAGSVQKAVITETRKEFKRADGSTLKFDKNACVLVDPKGQPIGTRVLGFATHELPTVIFAIVGLGTFVSVLMTSTAKKLGAKQEAPSMEDRMKIFDQPSTKK